MQAKTEFVTKAEAARRFKVSRAMVGKYIQNGMPFDAEIKRLNWENASKWHHNNVISEMSGSYAARQAKAQRERDKSKRTGLARSGEPIDLTDPATLGFTLGQIYMRRCLRENFPAVFGGVPARRAKERVALLATLDLMFDGWIDGADGWIDGAEGIDYPEPDWSAFKALKPDEAREVFAAVQEYLASGDDAVNTNRKGRKKR